MWSHPWRDIVAETRPDGERLSAYSSRFAVWRNWGSGIGGLSLKEDIMLRSFSVGCTMYVMG